MGCRLPCREGGSTAPAAPAPAPGSPRDPAAMLCELQQALQAALLDPAQLLELELAWLGMTPVQQRCLHRAVARAAPAPPRGLGGSSGLGAGAAGARSKAVRQLAQRTLGVLQAQRREPEGAVAPAHDALGMLCSIQDMLAGARLAPGQLTQLELLWLGPKSPAWRESIGRMVARAHAQGTGALRQVVTAVLRTG